MEYNTTTVQTEAGDYRISEHYDEDGGMGNPLEEYDHDGIEVFLYRRDYPGWNVQHNSVGESKAGKALADTIYEHGGYGDNDDVVRRMRKWLSITGSPVTFVTGQVSVQRYDLNYLALVTSDEYTKPVEAVKATMSEYEAWANGEVYGYTVEGPDGSHVDSCWGFIGDESRAYMLDQARDSIAYDAQQRLDKANLAGAGFVGIV